MFIISQQLSEELINDEEASYCRGYFRFSFAGTLDALVTEG
jgi:hypothetical protein